MKKSTTLLFIFLSQFQLSVEARTLAECPSSPNCVSSQSASPSHKIEPLAFKGTAEDFKNLIAYLAEKMPRVKIVTQESNFAHLEFTTLILRFVDDVELVFDETNSIIHVRSASRVGYSDLGANRKRVGEIARWIQNFQKNKI
jgi:uncharacterized protein (DUF1499 family)